MSHHLTDGVCVAFRFDFWNCCSHIFFADITWAGNTATLPYHSHCDLGTSVFSRDHFNGKHPARNNLGKAYIASLLQISWQASYLMGHPHSLFAHCDWESSLVQELVICTWLDSIWHMLSEVSGCFCDMLQCYPANKVWCISFSLCRLHCCVFPCYLPKQLLPPHCTPFPWWTGSSINAAASPYAVISLTHHSKTSKASLESLADIISS